MANEKQLAILKQGAEIWRQWRQDNPKENIDLLDANLSKANLLDANLSKANLHLANLLDANLSKANLHLANLKQANLSNANLKQANLSKANLYGANLSKANLHLANLSRANLSNANLSEAFLNGADLSGAFFDSKSDFSNAKVKAAKVERYQLERLNNYGGLTKGDLMDMEIEDGVVTLRSSYSGFKQWIHLTALAVFLFPYVWFVVSRWSAAKFVAGAQSVFPDADGHMPLWQALGYFIYNGGISWKTGPARHWLFYAFIFMLLYNVLRGVLLWKTKSLENYQDASGLRAIFSLKTSNVRVWMWELKFLNWGYLYNVAQVGFFVAIAVALLNSWHFFTQEIPIYLP